MAIFAKYRYKISVVNNNKTESILKMLEKWVMILKIKRFGLLVDTLPNTNPIDGSN